MPGLAEKNALILRKYLGQNRKPTKAEYEASKEHRIPPVWSPGQSQNWWVLGVGVRFAYGDYSELEGVNQRLKLEQEEIGTWGSEQHSPVYWGFHLVGRMSILKNSTSDIVNARIKSQLSDWNLNNELALSPDRKLVIQCGMRGTGDGAGQFSSYEEWWLYATYTLGLSPKKKIYWRTNPDQYGWLSSPYVGAVLKDCKPDVMKAYGVRSPTHYITYGPANKWVYTEDDQHSSTVFRGGGGILGGKQVAAPVNYAKHNRGAGAGSRMTVTSTPGHLKAVYSGPYNNIAGAKPVVYDGPVPEVTGYVLWDKNGVRILK